MDMDLSSDEDVYPPVSEVSGSLGAKVPSTSAPKKKKKPPLIPPVTKAKIKLASSSARQKDPLLPVSVVASASHTGQPASVTGASKGPPLHQVSNSTGVNGQVERGPSTGVGGGSTASQTVNGQDSVTPVCVSLAPSTHSQLGYGANVDQPSSVWDPSGTPLAVLSSAPNPVGPGAPLPVVSEVGTLGPRMSHVIQGPSNPTGHGSYPQGVMRPAYGYPIPRISGYPTRPGFSDIRFSGYPDNRPPGYSDFRISGFRITALGSLVTQTRGSPAFRIQAGQRRRRSPTRLTAHTLPIRSGSGVVAYLDLKDRLTPTRLRRPRVLWLLPLRPLRLPSGPSMGPGQPRLPHRMSL